MFRWLSDATQGLIDGASTVLNLICDIRYMLENGNNYEEIQRLISEFENMEIPDEIWSKIVTSFPDLIDELNDIRITVLGENSSSEALAEEDNSSQASQESNQESNSA